jgi:hypothetical protein
LIQFISAAAPLSNVISDIFSFNFENIFNSVDTISSLLLTTLVVLAVYSLMSFLPLFGDSSEGIKWSASIIIGILSFLYVDITTIKTILINYETLGVILTSIIPFLIIFAFSLRLESAKTGPNFIFNWFLNKFLLIGFGVYLAVKIGNSMKDASFSKTLLIIYIITFAITIVWFFIQKKVLYKAKKDLVEEELNQYEKETLLSRGYTLTNAKAVKRKK